MDSLTTALCRALLVAACLVALSRPVHAVNGSCSFHAKGTMTLAFGSIDPSSAANAVASVTANTFAEIGDCRDAPMLMLVTADNGQNASGGSRRLSKAGTDFIPYSLTVPGSAARPGNNRWVALAITGTIAPADFQNAPAGSYSDSVIVTVTP